MDCVSPCYNQIGWLGGKKPNYRPTYLLRLCWYVNFASVTDLLLFCRICWIAFLCFRFWFFCGCDQSGARENTRCHQRHADTRNWYFVNWFFSRLLLLLFVSRWLHWETSSGDERICPPQIAYGVVQITLRYCWCLWPEVLPQPLMVKAVLRDYPVMS